MIPFPEVTLRAIRQLVYPTIDPPLPGQRPYQTAPGQRFRVPEDVAERLEAMGLAERCGEPEPDFPPFLAKMLGPTENKMLPVEENKTIVVAPARKRGRPRKQV